MCESLTFLLDEIYIRFGSELNRQIVGIPMGTNCAPLVADLFMFRYGRVFMLSLLNVAPQQDWLHLGKEAVPIRR